MTCGHRFVEADDAAFSFLLAPLHLQPSSVIELGLNSKSKCNRLWTLVVKNPAVQTIQPRRLWQLQEQDKMNVLVTW
jgi:hypothetical protein